MTAWLLPGQACKLLRYVAGKNTFTLLFKRWQTQCLHRQFWRLSQVITFTAPLRFLDSDGRCRQLGDWNQRAEVCHTARSTRRLTCIDILAKRQPPRHCHSQAWSAASSGEMVFHPCCCYVFWRAATPLVRWTRRATAQCASAPMASVGFAYVCACLLLLQCATAAELIGSRSSHSSPTMRSRHRVARLGVTWLLLLAGDG